MKDFVYKFFTGGPNSLPILCWILLVIHIIWMIFDPGTFHCSTDWSC
jgi:hypothetical protein